MERSIFELYPDSLPVTLAMMWIAWITSLINQLTGWFRRGTDKRICAAGLIAVSWLGWPLPAGAIAPINLHPMDLTRLAQGDYWADAAQVRVIADLQDMDLSPTDWWDLITAFDDDDDADALKADDKAAKQAEKAALKAAKKGAKAERQAVKAAEKSPPEREESY